MSRKVVPIYDRHASPFLTQLEQFDKRTAPGDGQLTIYGVLKDSSATMRLLPKVILMFCIFQATLATDIIVNWSPESVL